MSDQYIGEIRLFAGTYAPEGWSFCDGSLVSIADNDVLYQLIGTTYGGDGQNTFAVPDLRGAAPRHVGGGAPLGSVVGAETVTLNTPHLPSHTHTVQVTSSPATLSSPAGGLLAKSDGAITSFTNDVPTVPLRSPGTTSAGQSGSHNNMQPYLALNFIIALVGIYPTRP